MSNKKGLDILEKWPGLRRITLHDGDYGFVVNLRSGTALITRQDQPILCLKLPAVQSLISRLEVVEQVLAHPDPDSVESAPSPAPAIPAPAIPAPGELATLPNDPDLGPSQEPLNTCVTVTGDKIDLTTLRPGDRIEWEAYARRKQAGPNAGKLRSGATPHKGTVVATNTPGETWQQAWKMVWAPGYRCVRGLTGSVSIYTPSEPGVEHINPKASFCSWSESKAGAIVRREDGVYSSARDFTVRAVWRQAGPKTWMMVWRREDVRF
ncbi:MAG: hypothetical protein K0U62_11555 [Actinomycetia bacterium]|nr:hypothetical protein [Actinomycetes bacterium]